MTLPLLHDPGPPHPRPKTLPLRWPHQRWGTLADPIHKSQLTTLVGEYACTEQFRRDRIAELEGLEPTHVAGQTVTGTACHEVLARCLRAPDLLDRLRAGETVTLAAVRAVLDEEYAREAGDREVRWYKGEDVADELQSAAVMVHALLLDLPKRIRRPLLVEAGFICPLGPYWIEGHVDLVYENLAGEVCLLDWKRTASVPHPIALDHGWEAGLYATALHQGYFIERDAVPVAAGTSARAAMHAALRDAVRTMQRGAEPVPAHAQQVGVFPSEIHLVQLRDYYPYQKRGRKEVKRPEELQHYGLTEPGRVTYEAGQQRGPGWYRVRRTVQDQPRLQALLRGVVGWVRMGKFVRSVGEKCTRCRYRQECLTGGYELTGEALQALQASVRGMVADDGLQGLDTND